MDKLHPGVHQVQHHHLVKGVDYPAVFSIECFAKLWVVLIKKDAKSLKYVERKEGKLVKLVEGISYEQQLRTWVFSSSEKKSLRRDLIAFCALLRREDGERKVLNSFPWDSVIRFMGMVQSCVRRGSD